MELFQLLFIFFYHDLRLKSTMKGEIGSLRLTGSTRQPDEPSLIAMYHGSNEQFVVLDKLL